MYQEFISTIPAATGWSSDEVSFADTVFGFWEDAHVLVPPGNSSDSSNDELDYNDEEEDGSFCNLEKNKAFWEEQEQLLKATLCRTSSREMKIRQAVKEALGELSISEVLCFCRRPVATRSCRDCLRREMCDRLLNLGYNCVICKSKWRSSSEIPSGSLWSAFKGICLNHGAQLSLASSSRHKGIYHGTNLCCLCHGMEHPT
ncbi:uncharacterized protein LOC130733459 isoform X3 [Lotus japonicus]|uniref:uncharacterized protein LOC130733459 isoform X3 n=1 Tax=Lotus japonicus TaxID=34305 RepID=UPI002586E50C|nr:uncharacterized protein LOC130733459 isoform X3 [Lotus japonicus]